jgi:hypothetical protein
MYFFYLQRLAKLMKEADLEVFAQNPVNLFTSVFTKRRREKLYKAIFEIFEEVCRSGRRMCSISRCLPVSPIQVRTSLTTDDRGPPRPGRSL